MTIKNLYPSFPPSLNLDFANSKRLDSRITFTRSSTGTYFGSDGLLRSAAVNEARFDHDPATGESLGLLVEESRTNVATYSENLTSSTFASSGASLQPNSTLSLNGLFNAYKIVENTANSSHYIGTSFVSGSGYVYVFSFFIKASGRTSIYVEPEPGNFTGSGGWIFDLSTGTYSGFRSGQQQVAISSVGGGWYKCICSSMASINGTNSFRIYLYSGSSTYTGDGSSGVQICCPQIEIGNFATSYIPTPATFTSRASSATYYDASGVIQTAGTNVARSAAFFPDSNGTMQSAGLLLEAAATNIVTNSATGFAFDAGNPPLGASYSSASIVDPTGATSTVNLLTQDTSTGNHRVYRFTNNTYTDWRGSFFIKANGTTKVRVAANVTYGAHYIDIDLSSGTITATNGIGGQLQKLANGWYRVLNVGLNADKPDRFGLFLLDSSGNLSFTGNGTSGVYLWGVQIEQAAGTTYSTSYISTGASTVTRSADVSSSATVTRSADVASMTASPYLYGTFLARYRQQPPAGLDRNIFTVGASNAYSGAFICQAKAANVLSLVVSPVADLLYTANTEPSGFNNVAAARVLGDYALCLNGGTVAKSTLTTDSANNSVITFMYGTIGVTSGGHVSRFTYWPVRLSDTILQELTR